MKRVFLAFSLVSLLAGCAATSTLQGMQSDPATLTQTRTFPDDYQVIYDRISRRLDVCFGPTIEREFHPEQGFGRVSLINEHGIPSSYVVSARIEKNGSGTKVTINSGNNWAKQGYIDDVIRWASGDTKCTPGWII